MIFLNISLPYKLSSTDNTKVNEHFCFRSYDLVKNAVNTELSVSNKSVLSFILHKPLCNNHNN